MNQKVLAGTLKRLAKLCELIEEEGEDPIRIDSIRGALKYLEKLDLSDYPMITIGPGGYVHIDFRQGDKRFLSIRFINDDLCEYASSYNQSSSNYFQIEDLPLWEDNIYKKFYELKDDWKKECSFLSDTTKIICHPSYQEIISMGEEAVEIILNDLKHDPDHWFYALKSITNENPIDINSIGNIHKMADDWIEWGRKKGYNI